MNNSSKSEYEVGYGKPPKEHRFRKGQSGNPSGRTKKSKPAASAKSLAERVFEIAEEPLIVNMNGRQVTMSKLDAMLQKLFHQSALGDTKSFKILQGLVEEGRQKASARIVNELSEERLRELAKDPHAAARAYQRMLNYR